AELSGRAFIAEGLADVHGRRYAEGVGKLRVGLRLYPAETQARLVLAQIFARANQSSLARATLLERLRVGYPGREFLAALFSLAEESEDFAVIVGACARFRDRRSFQTEPDRPWLLERQLQALLAARRYDEALRLAEAEDAAAPAAIREARVLALIALERNDEAIGFLAAWVEHAGENQARVVRLQVRAFREARRWAEMDAALQTLRSLAPTDPRPAAFGVVQRAMAGRDKPAAAALEDYFFRFGGSRENLLLVAQALAANAGPALVTRSLDRAISLGYDPQPFRMQLFLARMQRGDWPAAQLLLDQLRS